MEDWEQRIEKILGADFGRSFEDAERYLAYLKKSLVLPLRVTGREDFPWEGPYVIGGGREREYAAKKKNNPSYTDSFDLLDLLPPNEDEDVTAKIKRVSDGKVFSIGLSWLTTEKEEGPDFELLDDYATWHANY
jgi:hypothetical protein